MADGKMIDMILGVMYMNSTTALPLSGAILLASFNDRAMLYCLSAGEMVLRDHSTISSTTLQALSCQEHLSTDCNIWY
jgi:hypothetical protein